MPYLTLWATMSRSRPVSTLNDLDGLITSNMGIVPTIDGSIDAYAAGLRQMTLDISRIFRAVRDGCPGSRGVRDPGELTPAKKVRSIRLGLREPL